MKGRSIVLFVNKMAESDFYEKLSIRDSVKSLKKYGSTSTHMKRQENLVRHTIESSDTLQGIALKYGVTTEQIRRANRLWASDSLFLREYLMIPVGNDSPYVSPTNELNPSSFKHTNNNSSRANTSTSDDIDEPTIDSFLSNIDTSIANTKKDVQRAKGNSEFVKEMELEPCTYQKKKHAVSRMRQSAMVGNNKIYINGGNQQTTSRASVLNTIQPPPDILHNTQSYQNMSSSSAAINNSNSFAPVQHHTVPMVITQTGRKLRTSLQRLEQQQDEMFEL